MESNTVVDLSESKHECLTERKVGLLPIRHDLPDRSHEPSRTDSGVLGLGVGRCERHLLTTREHHASCILEIREDPPRAECRTRDDDPSPICRLPPV